MQCKISGCTREQRARQRCSKHYQRWMKSHPDFKDLRIKAPNGAIYIDGNKWCTQCASYKDLKCFYRRRRGTAYMSYCIDCYAQQAAEKYLKLRHATLEAMGGKCVQCGFDDWRALQIDHVHGGGTAEFKTIHPGSRSYFEKVLANPDDYQLLCANCNWIKKIEHGEVPGRRASLR